jgi:TPR repeat protein
MYLDGNGVQQDFLQAYHLFDESKTLHHSDAENIFQVPIHYGKNNDIDYEKLFTMLNLVCSNGSNSNELEYNIGYHYEHEANYQYKLERCKTKVNLRQAKKWCHKAASKGDPKAQYRLGAMYERGKGFSQNWSKALDFYEKARANASNNATYRLAHMYLNGYGVSQDFQKVLDLFMEASHSTPKVAVEFLHKLYETTRGEDDLDFKNVLGKIAASGNIVIQYRLGLLYINTEPKSFGDIQEGVKWLLRASEGGYIDASY